MKCNYCNKENEEGLRFCRNCGYTLFVEDIEISKDIVDNKVNNYGEEAKIEKFINEDEKKYAILIIIITCLGVLFSIFIDAISTFFFVVANVILSRKLESTDRLSNIAKVLNFALILYLFIFLALSL